MKKATVNGFSVTCLFALDDKATIRDIQKKNKNLVANSKAQNMPVRLLEPLFVAYVGHCNSLGSNVLLISKINNCYPEELSSQNYYTFFLILEVTVNLPLNSSTYLTSLIL